MTTPPDIVLIIFTALGGLLLLTIGVIALLLLTGNQDEEPIDDSAEYQTRKSLEAASVRCAVRREGNRLRRELRQEMEDLS